MKTKEKSMLSLTEIKERVSEIREDWGPYERMLRRMAGEARCEVLESLLGITENQAAKVA